MSPTGHYRARDLLLVPGLLSLARLPLAMLFPFVARVPVFALVVLLVAGFTDVLDGWYARRYKQTTPTGAVVDPITDKLFVASVVTTLLARGQLSPEGVLMLAAREIGELPLVLWFAASHTVRHARAAKASANLPGKTATLLQFLTTALALFGSPYVKGLLIATAVTGAVAAIAYWTREIVALRDRAAQPPAR
jgi:CDP-diacylglycerol---glycerol-3-phosphate 3-phosphatidyltransferase